MTTGSMSEYEQARQLHLADVEGQPSELIQRSIKSMEGIRDQHAARRVENEATHRTTLELIKKHYANEKTAINKSILELQRQLGQLRDRWTVLCEEETADCKEEIDRWLRDDASQRKLINAEQMMIDELKK
jgi:hypothetical protein